MKGCWRLPGREKKRRRLPEGFRKVRGCKVKECESRQRVQWREEMQRQRSMRWQKDQASPTWCNAGALERWTRCSHQKERCWRDREPRETREPPLQRSISRRPEHHNERVRSSTGPTRREPCSHLKRVPV